MGTFVVAFGHPRFGPLPDFSEIPDDIAIQDLVPVVAVKALDIGILSRLAGLDKC